MHNTGVRARARQKHYFTHTHTHGIKCRQKVCVGVWIWRIISFRFFRVFCFVEAATVRCKQNDTLHLIARHALYATHVHNNERVTHVCVYVVHVQGAQLHERGIYEPFFRDL